MARAVPRHSRVAAEATAERADEVEVKPLPLGLGVRARLHDWHTWLVQPVHASSLGVFRVVFSICMYVQATHFNYIFEDFMTSKGVYPYPGLGWVQARTPSHPVVAAGPEVGPKSRLFCFFERNRGYFEPVVSATIHRAMTQRSWC